MQWQQILRYIPPWQLRAAIDRAEAHDGSRFALHKKEDVPLNVETAHHFIVSRAGERQVWILFTDRGEHERSRSNQTMAGRSTILTPTNLTGPHEDGPAADLRKGLDGSK